MDLFLTNMQITSLHMTLIDGLEWCGLLLDYCDVFISCLDSHSDGTHSLQRIHWWASDVMQNFSKSVVLQANWAYSVTSYQSRFYMHLVLGKCFVPCGKGLIKGWIELRVAKETQCETTSNCAVSFIQNITFLTVCFILASPLILCRVNS